MHQGWKWTFKGRLPVCSAELQSLIGYSSLPLRSSCWAEPFHSVLLIKLTRSVCTRFQHTHLNKEFFKDFVFGKRFILVGMIALFSCTLRLLFLPYRTYSPMLQVQLTSEGTLRYHPPSGTPSRWFSERLIVPDYCVFLLKNQNINAI